MTLEQVQRIAAHQYIWDEMGPYARQRFFRTFGEALSPTSPIGWWLSCLLFMDPEGDYNRAHTWAEVFAAVERLATDSGDWPTFDTE